MTYVLGLTGSVGMGKSTTAKIFVDRGVPVWDADQSVHELYSNDKRVLAAISELVPGSVGANGVDRPTLRSAIEADDTLLKKIELIVHPLIAESRSEFLNHNADQPLVVLDIPILYEMGADRLCNGVLVVTATPEVQRKRVLARPGMTDAAFRLILSKQMPDAEKRARADFVLETDTLDNATRFVDDLIRQLTGDGHA